ncbi:hypothetical protein RUM43_009617, partial [Polyplax serrata]
YVHIGRNQRCDGPNVVTEIHMERFAETFRRVTSGEFVRRPPEPTSVAQGPILFEPTLITQ